MPDMMVISPDGQVKKRFASLHMALGILDNIEFEDDSEHYEAQIGDRLLGYSDGVIELTNDEEKMLGEDAVMNWLQEEPSIEINALSQKLDTFRGKAEQLDDITLVSYTCQSLKELVLENQVSDIPFNIDITLDTDALRQLDPIPDIVSMVSSQKGTEGIRSDLSTVLSELYNNALDHGILLLDSTIKKEPDGFFDYFEQRMERLAQLDDGEIRIQISLVPDERQLIVTLKNSGVGFNYDTVIAGDETDCFGRGISLIREICDSIEYSDGGTRVCIKLNL
jgi:anti-sigma regulatory factor (Ser/Thr protein kinase)